MSREAASKAPYIKKVANAEDEASGDSFEIFRFTKTLGRVGKIRVDRDKARDVEQLYKLLLKKNADLRLAGSKIINRELSRARCILASTWDPSTNDD